MDFTFESMGTQLQIKIWDELSPIMQTKIKQEILDFTYYYDETFSRFKKNSLVTKISQSPGKYSVPKDFIELLNLYKEFNLLTDGAMNPLIGNTISDLGYDANYSLRKKENIRPTPNFSETLRILESKNKNERENEAVIELTEKVLIDIGAIGKGFWVDKVAEILEKNKIRHYMINGSGDIFYKSPDPVGSLKVGLENPYSSSDSDKLIGSVEILNESICGSGTNKRNWSIRTQENLHHVVNALTSNPTENITAVWVKVKNKNLPTTYSDAIATALFFEDPKTLQAKVLEKFGFQFEYLIIKNNQEIIASPLFGFLPTQH